MPRTKISDIGEQMAAMAVKKASDLLDEHDSRKKRRELLNAESALGRTLFGTIPAGHQREFLLARKNVWIWHENWVDAVGNLQEMTVRYEVHPSGVFKRYNGGNYQKIEGSELDNFRKAAREYLKLVKTRLYY